MECRTCLVLNKSQWEHLKQQAHPANLHVEEEKAHDKREYYKALDEKSKEWKKTWPDTEEGVIAKFEARKQRQLAREVAFVKAFEEQKRRKFFDNTKAVAEARQKIFDKSCFGAQLISAVRESRAIEERQAQIEFKKLMKEEALKQDQVLGDKIASMTKNLYDFAKNDKEVQAKKKNANKEFATYNKIMHEHNKYEIAREKEEEKLGDREDARLMKLLLDDEKNEMVHCKVKMRKELKQYVADQKAHREEKLRRDQVNDALIEVSNNYHHRLWLGEKQTWDKVIRSRGESENYKKVCAIMQQAQEQQHNNYEKFIEKGIEKLGKKQKDEKDSLQKDLKPQEDHLRQIAEDYKAAEEIKEIKKHCNKCACDRQTLFSKPCKREIKKVIGGDEGDTLRPESFLTPSTKFSAALKKRAEEPTSWTALKGGHQQFALQAAASIKECKFKHMAMKVVDNYRKAYYLDSTSLPVPEN